MKSGTTGEIRELGRTHGVAVHIFAGSRPTHELLEELAPDAADRETFVRRPAPPCRCRARIPLGDGSIAGPRSTPSRSRPPELARPADDGRRYTVTFSRTHRCVEIDGSTTLLEAANLAGIRVPTGCRSGLCRAGVTHKLAGTTDRKLAGAPGGPDHRLRQPGMLRYRTGSLVRPMPMAHADASA